MTTTRELTGVALKILGLMEFITGAAGALLLLPHLFGAGPRGFQMGWVGTGGIVVTQLIAGGVLLTWGHRLAGVLIPDPQPVEIGLGEEWPRALYLCCVRVAGVIVVVHGIPKVLVQLTHYGFLRSQSTTLPIPASIWASGLGSLVYVALGFYLIRGGAVLLKMAEAAPKGGVAPES